MKKIMTVLVTLGAALALSGCGQRVTVSPNEVGQIMTAKGYKEQIIPTSTFRLDSCFWPGAICDKLVTLDASDQEIQEQIDLFMPKDKLKMKFDIRMVIAVNPDKYQLLFNKVPAAKSESGGYHIPINKAYNIYGKQIIRTVARELMSQYKISDIASNREAVGALLSEQLLTEVQSKTPFIVRYAGLADVDYPPIIVEAQNKAAERREQIAEEEAISKKNMIQLERESREATKQREIAVKKANAEAEVNQIISDSMTPEYFQYKQIEIMQQMASSDNKVFMPYGMIDTVGGQVLLGNQK